MVGFSLGGNKGSSEAETKPWAPQARELKYAFEQARDMYGAGPYQGNYVAPIDPYQRAAYAMAPAAGTMYSQAGQDIYGSGQDLLPYLQQAGQRYAGAAGGQWLDNYQNPMAGGMDADYVSSFIDNDLLNSQIAAAGRDTARSLYEGTLPGIQRQADAIGMGGSTRQTIRESLAERAADDRIGDISAGMRSNAYNQGVAGWQNMSNMQQNAAMADLQNQQFGTTGQYNIGATGADMMGTGAGMTGAGAETMAKFGDYGQGLNQTQIEGQMAQYYAPWDVLDRYMSIVGGRPWGTQSSGETTNVRAGMSGNLF